VETDECDDARPDDGVAHLAPAVAPEEVTTLLRDHHD